MKKIYLFLIALCAVTLISCSSTPADKIVDAYEDAISQVNKATTMEELSDISDATDAKIEKLVEENKDADATEADVKKMDEAKAKYNAAGEKKAMELLGM